MKARAKKRLTRRWAAMASSIDVMRGRVTMLIADSRGSMPVTMARRNAEEGSWRPGSRAPQRPDPVTVIVEQGGTFAALDGDADDGMIAGAN